MKPKHVFGKAMKLITWIIYSRMYRVYAATVILLIIILITYIPHWRSIPKLSPEFEQLQQSVVFSAEKLVHLDLKGAPPKIAYYKVLFPLLSSLGATGLLIEYEDMFPYTGMLKNITATNAYAVKDVKEIVKLAQDNNLSIIPLVQTFGHLEFILKTAQFKELREVPDYPQVICPTHNTTLVLLMDMIDQVIKLHIHSTTLHIGSDEVYNIGMCDRCVDTMQKNRWSKSQLFLYHLKNVAGYTKLKYPKLRLLTWDDEFRNIEAKELVDSQIANYIQPVVWKYTREVYSALSYSLFNKYSLVFPRIWIASAFKGATGSSQFFTNTAYHIDNHNSWLQVYARYKAHLNFQGILITGWQRYDHFAVLCELLPVAIPSLAMSLRLLQGHQDSPIEIAQIIKCEQPFAHCKYPGGELLDLVTELKDLHTDYNSLLADSRMQGWLTEYNVQYQFTNPQLIRDVESVIDRLKLDLMKLSQSFDAALMELYDNYTIKEWKETFIKPFQRTLDKLYEDKELLLRRDVWPRRPLS